jgi:carbon-monoxide dehydrogenase medium subunit
LYEWNDPAKEDIVPIVHQFEYTRANSLTEAIRLMEQQPDYALLAGGTDLIANIKDGLRTPARVIDIKGIAELATISFDNHYLQLGALVTYATLLESPLIREYFPLLAEAAGKVASGGIRNRATLVGNICSAVPCLDAGAPLMVYDTEVMVTGALGSRLIPIQEWFVAPRKTAIQPNEIVSAVRIRWPGPGYGTAYAKLGRYDGEDLAQATVAVLLGPDKSYRVAFGSVAPVPVRAAHIEGLLRGQALSPALIAAAQELVGQEISPITDIRASREYRLHMCKIMLERSLQIASERMGGQK